MIDFDDAPRAFSKLLIESLGKEAACGGRILRDIYGRLSFITPRPHDERFDDLRLAATRMLGPYGEPTTQLIISLSDDGPAFQDLLAETSIGVSVAGQPELRMIDRRLAGDDWLARPSQLASNPRRLPSIR